MSKEMNNYNKHVCLLYIIYIFLFNTKLLLRDSTHLLGFNFPLQKPETNHDKHAPTGTHANTFTFAGAAGGNCFQS